MTTKKPAQAAAKQAAQEAQRQKEIAKQQAEQQKAQAEHQRHVEKLNKRFQKCLKAVSGLSVQDVHQIADSMKGASNLSEYIYREDD